ncbi:MAG: hypothetical protein AAF217_03560 [Pseudomonadota bacterium]
MDTNPNKLLLALGLATILASAIVSTSAFAAKKGKGQRNNVPPPIVEQFNNPGYVHQVHSPHGSSGFSLHIGGGGYKGFYPPVPRYNGHGYGHKPHGRCHPRKALKKAWRMGVDQPHIARIGERRVVVVGYNRGHRAKVVFKRHHRKCRVIKTRGLY